MCSNPNRLREIKFFSQSLSAKAAILEIFHTIVRVSLIFLIVFIERKKPGEALIWVAIVFFFPVAGGILYFIFGSTVNIKLTYRARSREVYEVYRNEIESQIKLLHERNAKAHAIRGEEELAAYFNVNYAESILTQWNEIDLITSGEEKRQKLLDDISQAQHHIHVAYYAIHHDWLGIEFVEALAKKAAEGVRVRVLFDGMGSLGNARKLFGPLKKAGGEIKRIKPLLTHFRYHRKIVVIDGSLGYIGGMNIGRKYVGENPRKTPWRDTQVRIRGEAASLLQYYFLYDWMYANGLRNHIEASDEQAFLFPPIDHVQELPCQVIGSGVDTGKQVMKLSYLRMISLAQERIVIQSPYFIPSNSLSELLKVALSSGVEVILMLPGRRSNFFLDPTTRYHIAQLVPLGLKVFNYNGYLHAKTLRIDSGITCIGSVNIDIRSLEVDDEICAIFFGEEVAKKYDAIIDQDLKNSNELNYDALSNRGLLKRFTERFFLLFSPFM